MSTYNNVASQVNNFKWLFILHEDLSDKTEELKQNFQFNIRGLCVLHVASKEKENEIWHIVALHIWT